MNVVDAALRILEARIDGVQTPSTISWVWIKRQHCQREAGALLCVGESAFDKYERGLVEPSGLTVQHIQVFDGHPEFAEEFR